MYKESDLYRELYARAVQENVYVDFTPVSAESAHCVVLCTVSNKDGVHIVMGGETMAGDMPFLAAMEQAGLAALGKFYNVEVPVSVGETNTVIDDAKGNTTNEKSIADSVAKKDTPGPQSLGQHGTSSNTNNSAEQNPTSTVRQPSGSRGRQDSSAPPSTVGRTASNNAPGRQSGGPSSPPAGRTTTRPGEDMAQAGRSASGAGNNQAVNSPAASAGRPPSGNGRQNPAAADHAAAGSKTANSTRRTNTASQNASNTGGQNNPNMPHTNASNINSGGTEEKGSGDTPNKAEGENQTCPADSSAQENAPNPNMPKDFRVKIGAYARDENNYISYLIKHDPEFIRTVCRLENSLPTLKGEIDKVKEYVKASGITL